MNESARSVLMQAVIESSSGGRVQVPPSELRELLDSDAENAEHKKVRREVAADIHQLGVDIRAGRDWYAVIEVLRNQAAKLLEGLEAE